MPGFKQLCEDIRACTLCQAHLPLGPRPVFQAHPKARILIVGQAPGTAVHNTGVPFNDPSGDRLRQWLGVDHQTFYDARQIALLPMGFCYPGKGKGGDLPPRPECADAWRMDLLGHLQRIELTVCIGRYAIDWHLQTKRSDSLTHIVANWRLHSPAYIALPHPSPRNTMWLRKNPIVEAEIVPYLQQRVARILQRH